MKDGTVKENLLDTNQVKIKCIFEDLNKCILVCMAVFFLTNYYYSCMPVALSCPCHVCRSKFKSERYRLFHYHLTRSRQRQTQVTALNKMINKWILFYFGHKVSELTLKIFVTISDVA